MITQQGRGKAALLVVGMLAVIAFVTLRPAEQQVMLPAFCVFCGPLGGVDFLLNTALFIPLGLGLRLLTGRWITAVVIGALTTLVIESLQWRFVAGRDASLGDLIANTLGTMIGAWLAMSAPRALNASSDTARRLNPVFAVLASAVFAITALLLKPMNPVATWPVMLVGLVAVMAWKSAAFPTTFSVVGEALPRERRSTAFAIQSVLIRVPRVISAPLGGVAVAALGIVFGLRVCFAITVAIGIVVLWLQYRYFHDSRDTRTTSAAGVRLPGDLRRLLVADSLVRIGEGLAASFIVLYVTDVAHVPVARYGIFYAIQQAVAIVMYLPGAGIAGYAGRPPLVAATFFFFGAFPLAVRFASTDVAFIAAFVIGGLKELGEPARKSLIVDLAPQDRIGAAVGAYYGIRNLLVVPAGLVGGLLWQVRPQLPLEAAALVSGIGLFVFLLTIPKRQATQERNY